ncbi:MAG: hypothetical protein AAGH15_11640 [Myxococcota bacterium]
MFSAPLETPFGPLVVDPLGPALAAALLLGWYACVAPGGARRGWAFVAAWLTALAFGRAAVALEAATVEAGAGSFWGSGVSPAAATLGAGLAVFVVALRPRPMADALAPAGLLPLAAVALVDSVRAARMDAGGRYGAELALALVALTLFAGLWKGRPAFLARPGRRATLVATFVVASSLALDGLRDPPGLALRRGLTALVALALAALALRLGAQRTTA